MLGFGSYVTEYPNMAHIQGGESLMTHHPFHCRSVMKSVHNVDSSVPTPPILPMVLPLSGHNDAHRVSNLGVKVTTRF